MGDRIGERLIKVLGIRQAEGYKSDQEVKLEGATGEAFHMSVGSLAGTTRLL